MTCINCKHYETCADKWGDTRYYDSVEPMNTYTNVNHNCEKFEPNEEAKKQLQITNYEKIKNMSVEDMAAFMYDENENNYNYCDYCQHQRARAPHCVSINIQEDCIKARVNWLKAAAEESGAE